MGSGEQSTVQGSQVAPQTGQEPEVGADVKTWSNAAYWLALHGSLSLHS